jgi:hypothetical protein
MSGQRADLWTQSAPRRPTIWLNEPSYCAMRSSRAAIPGAPNALACALAVAQPGCALVLDWDDVQGTSVVEENVRGAESDRDAAQEPSRDAGADAGADAAVCLQYLDLDGDAYGDAARVLESCEPQPDYVLDARDCDDGDAAIHPDALESCDGVDQDCDGELDESACPAGCAGAAREGRSFMGCGTQLTHASANNECLRQGMRLADVYSAAENEFVLAFARAEGFTANTTAGVPDPYVWIGGSDVAEEGLWSHADGQFFWRGTADGGGFGHYENWASGEPNNDANPGEEDCLALRDDSSGSWNDFPCDNEAGFVCAKPVR